MFSYIKEYYNLKLYDNEKVKVFVKVNWITIEQYKDITGVDYVA
ncbi:XkdX family protein [Clostridium aquiflavi]|uniref:XkdX family protein n=1 Tax=Clostridium aquiflavi TaxID=3073603 RepID=A0ABU1EEP8_9CLOT|nr:XkdX family protein [Clostridium sp. 5N-1]MDR5586607.1 XkdX family protein [Clostridium sp. 5N-1]